MCRTSSRLLKSLWTPGIGIQNHLSGQLPCIRSWRNCNGAGKPSKTSSRDAPCRVHEKGGENNSSRLGDTTLVTCTPNGAPNPPTCSLPSLVAQEMRPIPLQARIAEQGFPVATYPTHDQRFNPATGQYEEFMVWTRCATSGIFPVGNGKFFDWIQC